VFRHGILSNTTLQQSFSQPPKVRWHLCKSGLLLTKLISRQELQFSIAEIAIGQMRSNLLHLISGQAMLSINQQPLRRRASCALEE